MYNETNCSKLIKILWHDGLGMSLYAKRLERGRFLWPSSADGVVTITPAQRQSDVYQREGIDLDVSTLADWVGASAATLMPLVDAIRSHVFAAERIHADDTTVGGCVLLLARPWRCASGAASGRLCRTDAGRRLRRLWQALRGQSQGRPDHRGRVPSRRGCFRPRPSQTRTSGLPASGSSRVSFAHGTAYWWTILAGGSGCRASMARKRDHGRLLWRPRLASHFFHIRVSWW